MTQPFVEEELPEEEEAAGGETQNRIFILVAIGLGGLFVVGLICIGLYAFVVAPQQRAAREAQVAAINATNTQVAIDAANTANPPTATLPPTAMPTNTPVAIAQVTDTPVIAIGGPSPSPGPSFTPSRTPTSAAIGGGAGAGTVTATFTRRPGAGTPSGIGGGEGLTATPTALPTTGFADEVGAPALFVAAVILVAVVFVARRLRTQNA